MSADIAKPDPEVPVVNVTKCDALVAPATTLTLVAVVANPETLPVTFPVNGPENAPAVKVFVEGL